MNINADVLDALAPGNPIRQLHDEAIQQSQQGQHDNLNKRMRFYLMHQLAAQAGLRHPALDWVNRVLLPSPGLWGNHVLR